MGAAEYFHRPTNLAFHNLITNQHFSDSLLRFNFRALLGNGLKFIPTPRYSMTWPELDQTIERFRKEVKVKCFMAGKQSDPNFNAKLYVKSNWEPNPGMNPDGLLERLDTFRNSFKKVCKLRIGSPNLSSHLRRTLKFLQNNRECLVIRCDKNLGPALIERDKYIKMIIRDHLCDTNTYQRLSEAEAASNIKSIRTHIISWIDSHKHSLSKNEQKFLLHHLQVSKKSPYAIFYGMMKVHKTPLKTRPVVSYSGSIAWALGVWIDSKLQGVAQQQKSYFKDSFELKKDLDKLTLQPNDFIFTADAVSMYTNIPTEKGLQLITNYLMRRFLHELPVRAICEALSIVMKNNIFQFGDMFFKQKTGTAMGAPPAPPWATIYMALSENQFLPYHDCLIFYRRFIDDVFGIWRWNGDCDKWNFFKKKLNNPFFELDWEISDLTKKMNFMDLTISIEGNKIETSLYEKPNNLHLFIPSNSCHPPGLLKGMINGHVFRVRTLCSKKSDQQLKLQEYFRCLVARGYDPEVLKKLFRVAQVQRITKERSSDRKRIFFHTRYHPKNTSPADIQKLWKTAISTPFGDIPLSNMRNYFGKKTGIDTLVISQRRSPNLGNILSYRKLDDTGPPASSYMD